MLHNFNDVVFNLLKKFIIKEIGYSFIAFGNSNLMIPGSELVVIP
jgi:hypothetical protein